MSHAKNQTFSSHCSRDIVELKILQSNWPTAFWPLSQEPDFHPNMGFTQANKINFHYRPNSEKIND